MSDYIIMGLYLAAVGVAIWIVATGLRGIK